MSDLSQLDAIADEFEELWDNGGTPQIESFLSRVPTQKRRELLKSLLEVEIECRLKWGDNPTAAEYSNRFSDHEDVVKEAFADTDVRLERRNINDDPQKNQLPDILVENSEIIGTTIGPYKILQKIGQGGMGQVFMAEQKEPVRRRVALKIIRTETPSREIIARFEAERQALAMMDHQNIARVLDAGITDDGLPYFAMELVKGIPLTDYCDQNKLTPEARLQLFAQTCRAIQHAHQKGIIHRDIKPSNVLVALSDGEPEVKVIDFGLAKALHDQTLLTEKTLFTQFGQIVGTPEYMSPEQAEMNNLDVDTRADVYSLGVLLFELLTGSTPLTRSRIQTEALDQILRLIRTEDVPRPSTRLSESAETLVGISARRSIEPRKLSALLCGDIDWIAVKALDKDRTRRYDGAASLADDVDRYLRQESIEARAPTLGYRLGKAVRRHKMAFITATLMIAMLVAGVVGTGSMWMHARTEASNARTAEAKMVVERDDAQEQKAAAQKSLYESLLSESRALRLANSRGFRDEVWDRLRRARGLVPTTSEELRIEATAVFGASAGLSPISLTAEREEITAFTTEPDSSRVAVAYGHGGISVLDSRNGKLLGRVDAGVRFDRIGFNDKLLVGFSFAARRVSAWRETTSGWKEEWKRRFDSKIHCTHISQNGEFAAVAVAAGKKATVVEAINTTDGATINTLKVAGTVRRIAISNTSNLIAFNRHGSTRNRVLDRRTPDSEKIFDADRSVILDLQFSPDERLIASGCEEGLTVHSVETSDMLTSLRGRRSTALCFAPDSETLAYCDSQSNEVRLWNVLSNREYRKIILAETPFSIAFAEHGKALAVVGDDLCELWPLATPEMLSVPGHQGGTTSVAFSRNNQQVASTGKDGVVKIYDAIRGNVTASIEAHSRGGQAVVFTNDGRFLASGGWDSDEIRIWDVANGEKVAKIEHNCGTLSSLTVSSTGAFLGIAGLKGIEIFETKIDHLKEKFEVGDKVRLTSRGAGQVAFNATDRYAVWSEFDKSGSTGTLHVRDLDSEVHVVSSRTVHRPYQCVSFFPFTDSVISLSPDFIAERWDVVSGRVGKSLNVHRINADVGTIYSSQLSLSADGQRLATSSPLGKGINIWNAETGSLILALPDGDGIIWSIAWSPDGQRLAIGRRSGIVDVWDVTRVERELREQVFSESDTRKR